MSRPDDAGDNPYHASTDFESFSHSQMLDMIQNADAGKVTDLGHKLNAIATKTQKIGTDLQTHMSQVDWGGEGGDAFRDWGSRVVSATLTLSDYSSNAGVFIVNAGQVLGEVQRDMPKVPSNAYHTVVAYRATKNIQGPYTDTAGVTPDHLDGVYGPYATNPTDAQYRSAQTALETARTSAADQMNKLGQAYNMATDVISTSQEPTFPPTPARIMPARPEDGRYDGGSEYVPGSTGRTGGTGGTARVPQEHFSVPGNTDLTPTHVAATTNSPVSPVSPVHLPKDPGLKLDSVGTLPPTAPVAPSLPTPLSPPVPPPTPPGMPLPVPPPSGLGPLPVSGLGPNGLGKVRLDVPPNEPNGLGVTRRTVQNEAETLNGNFSGYGPGGRMPGGGRVPVPGMNGGPVPGTSGLSAPAMGSNPGGRPPAPTSTITGGRQRLGGVESEEGAVPRGTVIGGAGSVSSGQGRGLYPTSFGSVGNQHREEADGRRRGTDEEPEGVIGGTPAREHRRTRRHARNFTVGGAGLGRERDETTDSEGEDTPHMWE